MIPGPNVAEPAPYQSPLDAPQVGSYRILAELARGGMAAVFLAVKPGTPPLAAAIKQIHPHLAHDPEFVAMLVDEARIASSIHHPNVVEILEYSLGQEGMQNYLVMEYVNGEPLNLLMRWAVTKGVRFDYDIAASMAADVASGLHCAHELRGPNGEPLELVHRDVSPQNVMVTFDGKVKLTDFGIAKAVGRLQRTQPGEIKGKLAYMSPEQAYARIVDRRSDVYSLGIVLFELALGRRLFGAKTDAETVKNIMNQVIPKPSVVDPNFPPGLEEIILAMLTTDVNQRFQSAGAVERALRAFAASGGPGNIPARLATIVRSLDPARYEAKTGLLARELARAPAVSPAPEEGDAPTLGRIDPALVATVMATPLVTPKASTSRPVTLPPPRSVPPPDHEPTLQTKKPSLPPAPRPVIESTVIGAPPAEALEAIRNSRLPTAPYAPAVPPTSNTRQIVAVMLVVGLVLSVALYVALRFALPHH